MTRVLYLHGFASGPSSSKAQFFRDRLEPAGLSVEILDLAENDFEHLTITSQLRVLERAARSEPVSLIGSSMGGYLSALYAARHPEVRRLVLLAPAFRFLSRWRERLGPAALDEWQRSGAVEVYHYGDRRNRRLAHGLLEDAEQYDAFPDFRQPALIFHGRYDDMVPAEYSEEFAAKHPNVTLEVVDSGHDLLNVLDIMARRVIHFLT